MNKETFSLKIFHEFRLGSAFYGQGSQLWAFISQTFFGKNIKFLCSLDWKFPEFSKTHPTFICSSLFKASRSLWTQKSVFFGTPCRLFVQFTIKTQVFKGIGRKFKLNSVELCACTENICVCCVSFYFLVTFSHSYDIWQHVTSHHKVPWSSDVKNGPLL